MLRSFVLSCVCALIAADPARGQTGEVSLRDQMFTLFEQNILLSRTPAGVGIVAHTPVFREDPVVRETTDLINQVSGQIGSQLSNYPLGSSVGGFTYGFDSSLGTFNRTTETFGPAFAERAATAGKGRYSMALNTFRASYESLDGQSLRDGDIRFNLFHQRLTPASYVEGDVIQAALRMRLVSDTTSFLFNYGVTDRLDVGVAVPIVRVEMDLSYQATILDFATRTASPTTHVFANGTKTQTFTAGGSASGVGDVVLRGRYSFARRGINGVAVGLDLRVPSGDEANMLGTGATQTRLFLIASSGGRFSPHLNVGYTASSGNANIPDVVNYAGGVEHAVHRRVTLNADLVGRSSRNALRLRSSVVSHRFQPGPGAAAQQATLESIAITPRTLSTAFGALGTKVNVWRNLLLSAHVLIPMTDAGLRSRTSLAAGLDYSF